MLIKVLIPLCVIFIVMLPLKFPIYSVLLAATLYLQIFVNHMPLDNVVTAMFAALTRNSLLAVPFFVLAGNLMSTGSLGSRLVDLFAVFMKKIPGGLALSCVGANAVFGAISGSAPAATGAFGKILWKPLSKEYGEQEAAGLITSSGSLSTIIPPALPLITYGIVTETSLANLFMAAFLPGVLCVIILGAYLWVRHRKSTVDAVFERGERGRALKRGIVALFMPIIILGGIYGGFFTPTEAGGIAALYAAVVSLLIIKDIKLRQFFSIFKESAVTTARVFILIAISTAFSQALTISQAPKALQEMMTTLPPFAFLLILNVILLIMGCFFDPSAANLVIAPLLVPIGLALGLNAVHIGIIFAVNLSIGMFTPPFGLSLFVSQSVLDRPMALIVRGCIPFLFCYLIALLLITYIPQISLILPQLLR